jgi:hypothetical protein
MLSSELGTNLRRPEFVTLIAGTGRCGARAVAGDKLQGWTASFYESTLKCRRCLEIM